jgi:hypothetical protein
MRGGGRATAPPAHRAGVPGAIAILGRKATPPGGGPATGAGLGEVGGTGQITAMPRPILALLVGLMGFLIYVGVVVALADHVLRLHWLVQAAYFLVAGVAWVLPARALMFWAARSGS